MLKIKIPILAPTSPRILKPTDENKVQIMISNEVCKTIAKNFKGQVPVFIGETLVGLVNEVEYSEEEEILFALMDLYITAGAGLDQKTMKFMKVPAGKQLIDGIMSRVNLVPTIKAEEDKGVKK